MKQSVYISYKGNQLESGKRYYWQVRVWDNKEQKSKWSEPAYFQIFSGQKNQYGKDIALLFQINIENEDGTKDNIISGHPGNPLEARS